MAGVWVFRPNGVINLENHQGKKALVHLATGKIVSSYSSLEQILKQFGWERYNGGDPDFLQFHKPPTIDLISLPRDFARFGSVQMFDIALKCPNTFHVRDM
ncbi:flowering-promoting factor 1-like protein 2 [Quercus robur]|uniref:Flowering-promoting factor 1 n=1 Tax=Quercus lobata TaxID=97700 RepID=A0A7N2N4H1_QUELO|nr:flowering-promoting factor 1-like protein 2 [Quercus lobata]XP_050266443.1 flowering-promoting factor 1-like protein 2 [Quercus robur]